MTDFDYSTWAAQGRANADKLPSGVAEALGPERDWADELAREFWNAPALGLIEFLRTRCRPIGNDITDDFCDEAIARILEAMNRHGPAADIRAGIRPVSARETLRTIIKEATNG